VSDETRADADGISDFGMQTVEQTKTLADGFTSNAADVMGANVGVSGLDTAAYFQGSYANHAEALAAFIAEAGDGLMSLGYAGVTVAQNYRDGDADQQSLMDGVGAAFAPPPGTPSLQRDREEQQRNAADQGPATGDAPTAWSPPPPTGPMVCTPNGNVPAGSGEDDEPTPFEEVQDVNEDIGDGAEADFNAADHADETRENVERAEDEADDEVLMAPGDPSAASPSPATA